MIALLSVYAGFTATLYIFLPIDNGFEDATNNFVTVFHATIAFLTAIMAYFIIKRPLHPEKNLGEEGGQDGSRKDDKTVRIVKTSKVMQFAV